MFVSDFFHRRADNQIVQVVVDKYGERRNPQQQHGAPFRFRIFANGFAEAVERARLFDQPQQNSEKERYEDNPQNAVGF